MILCVSVCFVVQCVSNFLLWIVTVQLQFSGVLSTEL